MRQTLVRREGAAVEVAERLGLAHRNTVSLYQRRYADMPRAVVDLGPGRPKLWLKSEIDRWAKARLQARKASSSDLAAD